MRHIGFIVILILCVAADEARAQNTQRLTLQEAETIALQNRPLIKAAQSRVAAANEIPSELRANYMPTLYGNMTGADAPNGTRIAAGALNNPTILSRYASGVSVNQLITDFGRTSNLIKNAQLHAQSEDALAQATRANVLLQVNQSYFNVLRAKAQLRAAQETVGARQLILDQITALTNSKLKSVLDLSFAKVSLEEAKLQEMKAQNDVNGAFAQLSAALGFGDDRKFDLAEEAMPPAPPSDLAALIKDASEKRPELVSSRFETQAAYKFVEAEKDLSKPDYHGARRCRLYAVSHNRIERLLCGCRIQYQFADFQRQSVSPPNGGGGI